MCGAFPKDCTCSPRELFFVDLDEMPVPQLKLFIGASIPSFFRLFSGVALDYISPPARLPGTVTSKCLTLYFRHIALILFDTELEVCPLQGEPKIQAG